MEYRKKISEHDRVPRMEEAARLIHGSLPGKKFTIFGLDPSGEPLGIRAFFQ
jgi:hypothetical protein